MRCAFKYLHIKEKGEIITPTSSTLIFKPIHPLGLSPIKMLPPKKVYTRYIMAGRATPSSCCAKRSNSRQEPGLCWRQIKLQSVPKINVKSSAGSLISPRHGNHSTIVTFARQLFPHLPRSKKETWPSEPFLSPAHVFPGPPNKLHLSQEFSPGEGRGSKSWYH